MSFSNYSPFFYIYYANLFPYISIYPDSFCPKKTTSISQLYQLHQKKNLSLNVQQGPNSAKKRVKRF